MRSSARRKSKTPAAVLILAAAALAVGLQSPEAFGQPLPQDLDFSGRCEVLLDAGYLWDVNSLFHPLQCPVGDPLQGAAARDNPRRWIADYLLDYCTATPGDTTLTLRLIPGLGAAGERGVARRYDKTTFQPFVWADLRFRKSWYAQVHLRATNEAASLPHYSGVSQEISRLGFNTAEFDRSTVGYRGGWATVEFGRGREIWGAAAEDNLALAGAAPAYERLLLEARWRSLTYRTFYGFLEVYRDEDDGDIQRYIVGRCLEYRNRRSLVAGVAETSLLAGEHRPLDLSLLNPLALHIESEQNKRTNAVGNLNNALWSAYLDWLARPNLRVSLSFIIDEVKLESGERAESPDALGYLGRAAWTPLRRPVGVTLVATAVRLDTYTFQHNHGWCNFVTRDRLLGHPIGSDADRNSIAVRVAPPLPVTCELELGRCRWGQNSLIDQPYEPYGDYRSQPFPSGEVRENRYLELRLDSRITKGLDARLDGHIDLSHHGTGSAGELWRLSLRYAPAFHLSLRD